MKKNQVKQLSRYMIFPVIKGDLATTIPDDPIKFKKEYIDYAINRAENIFSKVNYQQK